MIKKQRFFVFFMFISLWLSAQQNDYSKYVNPFIGTGGHGHTFPGATMPFGMVQLSPDTRLTGWDGCSAYHFSDSVIYGFSHTHLSGTGCSDYGDILLMPVSGKVDLINYAYASPYLHKNEKASPGYYSVKLDKHNIQADLTVTPRVGFHKYTYVASQNHIVLDLEHRDMVLESYVEWVSNTHIRGMRRSKAWATNQTVYFDIQFSKPFSSYQLCLIDDAGKIINSNTKAEGKKVKAFFSFGNEKEILVKVALSATSVDGAAANMNAELPGWDFDQTHKNAKAAWNKELSKIEVSSPVYNDMVNFYSALYHCMIQPNIYSDVDGKYLGRDFKVHQTEGFDYYTVFSLWDTFRAEHPLLSMIDRKRTNDFIQTFIKQHEQGGLLPVWELSSNETECMIGYHAVPVIYDAYQKGIRNYDIAKALKAVIASADSKKFGLEHYVQYGYLPGDKESESVSRTLEYAYDDWCIAMMAKAMGNQDEYNRFIRRAQFYKNIFDKETGFMRPKVNSSWHVPFDPSEVNFHFTEANSWQYSFFVPQDITGLIALHGGKEVFEKKLDELFTTNVTLSGREQADITGLVGQYAHGNEPSHHMAYLYNYINKPYKTQELVNKILTTLYTNQTDGLCGNEDCGQMSAWYVLSAIGIYQVCPGNTQFALSTPLFSSVKIHLENGKTFEINTSNRTHQNCYIATAKLNGKDYNHGYITAEDIQKGGLLDIMAYSKPNYLWGSSNNQIPSTAINDYLLLPSPYITQTKKSFADSLLIEFKSIVPDVDIYYTTDGNQPNNNSKKYLGPFYITQSTQLHAISYHTTYQYSYPTESKFVKVSKNCDIKLFAQYNTQYTGGGNDALINGLRGGNDFRLGEWQGYNNTNFEAIVDLGSVKEIKKLNTGFLQDQNSWIFMPPKVEYEYSMDGKTFTPACTVSNPIPQDEMKSILHDFSCNVQIKAQYIKVKAPNAGPIPAWHISAGNPTWLFIDEIMVE